MPLVIKPNNELTPEEIERIFEIYSQTYQKKEVALYFNTWFQNLGKEYHQRWKKFTQLFGFEQGNIGAYSIETESFDLDGLVWSKIIEQAADKSDGMRRSDVFVEMMNDLSSSGGQRDVNYFSEIGTDQERVLELYGQSGFHHLNDLGLVTALLNESLGHNEFAFSETEAGLTVARKTALWETKPTYVMTNYEG